MLELALGQQMALEHDVDRLQVEFRGHVADRAIFVVEFLRRRGALLVADDEMLEHLPMADEVRAEVHRHEPGELEEARINLPPGARVDHRHGRDHVVLEPAERPLRRQRVDRGRRLAGVDRSAHHRQRLRPPRVLVRVHQRGRGKGRDRGLAHREQVRPFAGFLPMARGTRSDNRYNRRGRSSVRQRHQLRVAPVGDVDVVVR